MIFFVESRVRVREFGKIKPGMAEHGIAKPDPLKVATPIKFL